jgi:group I intron endonuclease
MVAGIYCIENMINGKKYVGQGINVEKRMKHPHSECKIIYDAIKKYGKENFKRYVLVYCEDFELERLEIRCIKIFRSHVSEWGYNVGWGGKSAMTGRTGEKNPFYGKTHSEKTKKLMSDMRLGKHRSEEIKKASSIARSGEKNVRFATKLPNASSQYFGVYRTNDKKSIYWQCKVGKKYLGRFKSEIDAAKAHDKYVIDNNINHPLNFPNDYR